MAVAQRRFALLGFLTLTWLLVVQLVPLAQSNGAVSRFDAAMAKVESDPGQWPDACIGSRLVSAWDALDDVVVDSLTRSAELDRVRGTLATLRGFWAPRPPETDRVGSVTLVKDWGQIRPTYDVRPIDSQTIVGSYGITNGADRWCGRFSVFYRESKGWARSWRVNTHLLPAAYPLGAAGHSALATVESELHGDGSHGELQAWQATGGTLVAVGPRYPFLWNFDAEVVDGRLIVTHADRYRCLDSDVAGWGLNRSRLTVAASDRGPTSVSESLAPWLATVDSACESVATGAAVSKMLAPLGKTPWGVWAASGDVIAGVGTVSLNGGRCQVDVRRTAGAWQIAGVRCAE